jgi:hypothetical protein
MLNLLRLDGEAHYISGLDKLDDRKKRRSRHGVTAPALIGALSVGLSDTGDFLGSGGVFGLGGWGG